jgi:ribonuclease HI
MQNQPQFQENEKKKRKKTTTKESIEEKKRRKICWKRKKRSQFCFFQVKGQQFLAENPAMQKQARKHYKQQQFCFFSLDTTLPFQLCLLANVTKKKKRHFFKGKEAAFLFIVYFSPKRFNLLL